MSEVKCRGYYKQCNNKATTQLINGEWYCDECYKAGLLEEEMAMGLYDKDYIQSLNQIGKPTEVTEKGGEDE